MTALRLIGSAASSPDANAARTRARNPRIARTLVELDRRLAERWTVARLAKVAGMSRAAFARVFRAEVGVPPRRLTARRLDRAARLLIETRHGLAAIAAEVGYASEFALSRAFRRSVGAPPREYRRQAIVTLRLETRARLAA